MMSTCNYMYSGKNTLEMYELHAHVAIDRP